MNHAAQLGLNAIRPGIAEGLAPTNGLYSSWNWNKGQYDYYESPSQQRPNYGDEVKPPPTQNSLGAALGEDPDHSSHGMPRRARYVGSGPLALGEIVSVAPSEGAISPWVGVALALVVPTGLLWLTVKLGDFMGERRDDFEV